MKNLTSIISIIVSIAVFFVFINPEREKIEVLQEEIRQNNVTLALATKLRAKREELRKRYNEISSEEREKLGKLLPDTVDNVRLIIDINEIAEKYKITIKDFEINSSDGQEKNVKPTNSEYTDIQQKSDLKYVDSSKVGVISFGFSLSSQYDVFNDFLKDLEKSLRIVDVRSIEILPGEKDGVYYNYRINLDTYWLK